jgi:penicillin G amidase
MLSNPHTRRSRASAALALGSAFAAAMLALPRTLATASPPAPARIPGLSAEAQIVTDRWGIPHVRARSLTDLYRAWGWVAARDRLWQMMWTRASGDGHTHRWVGNAALQADGGAQLFRLRERAHALWMRERRHANAREALTAYTEGVNAYLASCRRGERAWPAELRRLGAKPRDWTPEDCVLVMLGFGITLDLDLPELGEARSVLEHGTAGMRARRRFESRWMYDTIPDSAARRMWDARGRVPEATPVATGGTSPGRLSPMTRDAIAGWLEAFPPRDADGADRASNAFVVGARRSASGKPILANDPHLGLTTPGQFHVVHVSVPGMLDAVGASVAGLPIIATGRNPRVAWGVTALSADVVDVFRETISADGKRVWDTREPGAAKWVPVTTRAFDLQYRVLGVGVWIPPLVQERRYTPRGPVLAWDPKRRVALTAQWTALEDERISLAKLFGIERATRSQQVADAFATLVTPCFNLVVADVDGDARYLASGLLPDRQVEAPPGPIPADGRHEWRGFVARDRMPGWRVPSTGFAVNANNRPAGDAYPHALPRYDWPHDRARRMHQRLAGDASLTLRDAMSVQNDVRSLAAERNVRALLRCADSLAGALPARERAALDTLRAWDLLARRSKVAPTLYRAWFGAFQRRSGFEGLPGLAIASLEGAAPELDELPAVAAATALSMALDTLTAKLGPDLSRWHYRRAHQARFRHALSTLDPRSRWEPGLVSEDGDNATPSVGASRLPWTVEVTHGPVFRHVVDLASPLVSYAVVPPWNSTAFPPRGELDLRARWANHGYVPLHLDWTRIERVAMDRVRLAP